MPELLDYTKELTNIRAARADGIDARFRYTAAVPPVTAEAFILDCQARGVTPAARLREILEYQYTVLAAALVVSLDKPARLATETIAARMHLPPDEVAKQIVLSGLPEYAEAAALAESKRKAAFDKLKKSATWR